MTMRKTLLLLYFLAALCVSGFSQTARFISADRFSSSLISELCQDRQGGLWVATDYGLNRYDGYRFQTFLHDDGDSTSLAANMVVSLLCDRNGRLWVGTNHGLDRFEPDREQFIHYPFPDGITPHVSTILQTSDGTLLFGTAGYGIYTLDDKGRLKRYTMDKSDDFSVFLFEDSHGRLWRSGFDETIVMRQGGKIARYRSQVGAVQNFVEFADELIVVCLHGFLSFQKDKMSLADIDMSSVEGEDVIFTKVQVDFNGDLLVGTRGHGLYRIPSRRPLRLERVALDVAGFDQSTAKVSALLLDRQDNLWLGCERKGLILMPQRPMQFANWSFEAQGVRVGSTISSVCDGDNGMTWCTVQGVGVYGFDEQGHIKAHPSAPPAVEFIFRDRQKRYWLGTDDGLFAYDPLTGRSQQKVTFDCDKFNDMTSDDLGNIYISTFSRGFCVYNPVTGALKNYSMYDEQTKLGRLCNNWVMGMTTDRRGLLWMATSSGVACFDPSTTSFLSQGWQSQLDGVVCFDVCELRYGRLADGRQLNGSIAVGTEQGLYLYNPQTRKVERFPGSEQLNNKVVSYVVQSNEGGIWCATTQGLWQYDANSNTFIGHVKGNGLAHKEYIYGVGMHNEDDMIFFGHNDGLTVFSPRNVRENRLALDSLRLTDFRVGEVSVKRGTVINGVTVTDRAIDESTHFVLSYLDHTVTLAFSQFNFDNSEYVSFEYRVNSGDWIAIPAGVNEFTLGHLQPGNYRIVVRAQVAGMYTPSKIVMVTVGTPWYRSLTAYFIYFFLLTLLLGYVFYTYRRRANTQMNEEKMRFLINTTHDIRSPLTLIMSPLANLKRRLGDQQGESLRDINTIERNANRILNLVNQILDVRKIDKQQMSLHCRKTDLVAFIGGVCSMFDYNAKERNISFHFNHDGLERLDVWIDPGQFDKVVTNLLSNAFKYSFDGGTIDVRLTTSNGQAVMEVADTGAGMANDSLKHVFDRFYQGSNSRQLHISGTGIGLNLCKMIVDMHHGTIEARNRIDQRGSLFTVMLPLGDAHLTEAEKELLPNDYITATGMTATDVQETATATATQGDDAEQLTTDTAGTTAATPAPSSSTRRNVLIVDDDEELAQYIASELERYYRFTIGHNGREGLQQMLNAAAEGQGFDVVVSDVMMPEMDGFTMLRMIKTNMNVSHIPVVMLTSKADVANRLEGLERGADAFLAKPFDMHELHMVIDNLIHNRQRLKGKFSGAQQQADKVETVQVKGNDELLMERVMKSINKNLSDSEFNVDMLTREVGISRAQLHRKMKDMTGISTSEFIRNIRLEQAARLLKEQKINVTQVAFTVGFSNLAHFSTIFRKHFGVSPSEYAEREGDAEEK